MRFNRGFLISILIVVGGVFTAGIFLLREKVFVQPGGAPTLSPKKEGKEKVYTSATQFLNSPEEDAAHGRMHWADFDKHQDTAPVSLDSIFSEGGNISAEERNFVRFMSQKDFDIFRYGNGHAANYGFYLSFEHLENYAGNSYDDALKSLDAWGPHMLVDLHGLLFPENTLSLGDVNQAVAFSREYYLEKDLGLKYKDAEITLNSEKKEIYYGVVDGYVIVSTAKESLFEASKELFSLVP